MGLIKYGGPKRRKSGRDKVYLSSQVDCWVLAKRPKAFELPADRMRVLTHSSLGPGYLM